MEKIITPCMEELHPIEQITTQPKIALLAETGTIPSAAALAGEKAEWVSYMTWCDDFCLTEEFTTSDALRAVYNHPRIITRDKLPELY